MNDEHLRKLRNEATRNAETGRYQSFWVSWTGAGVMFLIGICVMVAAALAAKYSYDSRMAGSQLEPRHQEEIALGVAAHAALEYQMRRGALPRDVNELRADSQSLLPADWVLDGSLYFYERAGKPSLSWHGTDAAAVCSLEDATHARCIND